jgi:hypothetical protein
VDGVVAHVGLRVLLLLSVGSAAHAAYPPDRSPPTKPTIDGAPETDELRPSFTFGARDRRTPPSRLRFRCALDSAPLHACPRTYRPTDTLEFGRHLLRAQAVDRAGNRSRVASHTFTIVGRWNAAEDFASAPGQANPGPDTYGNTTWFYLYSGTLAHDPTNYHLMSVFAVLDPNTQIWRSTAAEFPSGSHVGLSGGQITMHPGHYNLGQNAILGWRSPVASPIAIRATISQNQTPCPVPQNGIIWSIDQGARTLQSGPLAPGQSKEVQLTTTVVAGDSLYLIVDGAGDTNCDGTLVGLTISTQAP